MTRYREFSTSGVVQNRRRKELEVVAKEEEQREALVRQGNALAALAEHMTLQNEKMLEGLKYLSAQSSSEPPAKVDHVSRNIANVSAARQGTDRKGQALMARAEVMAAATAHISGGSPAPAQARQPPMPTRTSRLGGSSTRLRAETEEDLVNAVLAEIEHGESLH